MVSTQANPIPALTRRAVLLSPLLALPAAAAPVMEGVPPGRRLQFQVMRGDSVIGSHALSFSVDGDALTVTIAVRIAVSMGPVTVFRYEMQATETWSSGQFVGLTSTTNDDGKHRQVSIRRNGDGLSVQSAGFPARTLPGGTTPLTHWSMATLTGQLFSPEDGQPVVGRVSPAGRQTVRLADGQAVPATCFDLAIHTPTRDWYDERQLWVALQARTRDGSVVDYRRTV